MLDVRAVPAVEIVDVEAPAAVNAKAAVWALLLLCLLYIVSLFDRIILTLLVQPLRARFQVGDVQISLLYGTSFALVFCLAGVFAARLADRGDRRRLVLIGVMLWSLGTLSSAFAPNFLTLVVCRAGLAVGEATLAPVAYSLIGDLFTARRRALASSTFLASGSVGAYFAFLVGGLVVAFANSTVWDASRLLHALEPWQRVLLMAGLPGTPIAALLYLTFAEPVRQGISSASSDRPDARAVARHLLHNWRAYLTLMLGCTSTSAVSQSLCAWLPEILHRNFAMPIGRAGIWTGIAGMLAIAIGILTVPMAVERYRRGRADRLIVAVCFSATVGYALTVLAMLQHNSLVMLVLVVPALALMSGCVSIGFNALMEIIPAQMRATLMALTLIVTTLVGIGLGPSLCAALAQTSTAGGLLNLGVVMVTVVVIPITFGSIALGWSHFRHGMAVAVQ